MAALWMFLLLQDDKAAFGRPLDVNPAPIRVDYDIVYVRAGRAGDKVHKRFYTDFSQPVTMEPGADLMLLHPGGSEELLAAGGDGSITDPFVSFDGQWIYFVRLYNLRKASQWTPPREGADIFKIHVPTRRLVRLTNQTFAPNAGAKPSTGVFNMGPCPLPGGRFVFTSNREGFRPSKGYPAIALQLFVMDDGDADVDPVDAYPRNIEKIGHLNIAGALHPVVLADGRIMFSTLESQGIRSEISWGIWTIRPDGTTWAPMVSAFDPGGASNGFHFQTQLSDGSVVVEEYYNQNNSGFGAYIKLPADSPGFGPGNRRDPRNAPWRFGRFDNGKGKWYRKPFMPIGAVSMTPFALNGEGPADHAIVGDKTSPSVGKVTHPSGAPDNHLLTVWSPGPVNHQYEHLPQLDGGIYLIEKGAVIDEPGDLRLIKNDPAYNESWPRALVPYERIYGRPEPARLERLRNPEGTPFGLVGSSSLYKRESYPDGAVPEGSVTAGYAGGRDPWRGLDAFTSHGNGMPLNWHNQGADAGLYTNEEIHAVRILAQEPTTHREGGRRFYNHASERLRILGEIPVRKEGVVDPDGNPDTSFLARIPADTAFTFQTIDRRGMVLNMAQTWHQVRPGEVRTDCGGCHAHSQKPTDFALTAAAKPDYAVRDLIVSRDVEYFRHVQPILVKSCAPCHTKKEEKPPGNLVLDDDDTWMQVEHHGKFPATYVRLALDERAKFGHKPPTYDSWGYPNASRYIRKLQSRRSLLTWKLFGARLDGFANEDHPSEPEPGAGGLVHKGKAVERREYYDLDFVGDPMPPPKAVADGKVAALTDEERGTIVRWIDLGCPIDLDYDPKNPEARGAGWMADDNRPVLTLETFGSPIARLLVGMHDYYSGLEPGSFAVTADVEVDGAAAGENLAGRFREKSAWVKEWVPRESLPAPCVLTVSVRDRAGNEAKIVRRLSVGPR